MTTYEDPDSTTITVEDVAVLNRSVVEPIARFAHGLSVAMFVVGTIGAAAFLWLAVRTQQRLEDEQFTPLGGQVEDVSWVDRLDALAPTVLYLVWAALAAGAGVGLRLLADAVLAMTGGSVGELQVGDSVVLDGDEEDDPIDPRS